jgi:asparagine synthase (glutamine-hydrolysing)
MSLQHVIDTSGENYSDVFPWSADTGGFRWRGIFHHKPPGQNDLRSLLRSERIQLVEWLRCLSGNFSLEYVDESFVFLAVDRIRSFSFFWAFEGDRLKWDSSARNLSHDLKLKKVNRESMLEFRALGYVTGKQTLIDDLNQLQAGEFLIYHRKSNELEIIQYYNYPAENQIVADRQEMISKLDLVHEEITRNLIFSVSNRMICVPLSGGYDSRLIVEMLARASYKNVVCFTYGTPNNREAKVASKLAKFLGYPWHFIEYSKTHWRSFYHSEERQDYFQYADQLSVLPHMSDWPAVKIMKDRGIATEDAVFVSGMSGDFLEGRHILPAARLGDVRREDVVDGILDAHYTQWSWRELGNDAQSKLRSKVSQQLPPQALFSPQQAINASYLWEWRQRQAKYTCNSVRAYEYWGYEWRLPLWDNRLMDFWAVVPWREQEGRILYREYVKKFSLVKSGSSDDKNLSTRAHSLAPSSVRRLAKKMHVAGGYKKIRRFLRKYFDHINVYRAFRLADYQRWYGFVRGLFEYLFYAFRVRGWGSLLILDYLNEWQSFCSKDSGRQSIPFDRHMPHKPLETKSLIEKSQRL